MALRHGLRAVWTLAVYVARTGRWWMPLLIVALAGATAVVTVAKVVVPTVVYTLF